MYTIPTIPDSESLLNRVKNFYFQKKRLPTYKEMAKLFGLTSSTSVAYIVHNWIKSGILRMQGRRLAPDSNFYSLPLLGVIKAGSPTNEETYDTYSISLDDYLIGNPGYTYLLRVSGDSMINEGIRSGDLVILDRKREPKNKDIVAALIDKQWTLKYFNRDQKKVYLTAANPQYDPMYPREELTIGGVVVKVIREYY